MSCNMRPYFVRIVHASVRTSVSWYLQRKNVLKKLGNKFCRPKIRIISKQKSTEKTLFQATTASCLGSSGTPWSAPTRAGSSTCRSSTLRSTTKPSTSVRYWVYMILCQIFPCGIYSFVCQKYTISEADFIIKCFLFPWFFISFSLSHFHPEKGKMKRTKPQIWNNWMLSLRQSPRLCPNKEAIVSQI